ncbi:MAG: class I SAM-dependent methyltransferase [Gammaproteobacteria bacterium]
MPAQQKVMELPESWMAPLPEFSLCPQNVKGFLHPSEGQVLYHLAKSQARDCQWPALEIGSYCGKSTLYLGYGCQSEAGLLFTLDHHQGSEEQQPDQEYFDPDLLNPRTGLVDTLPELMQNLRRAELLDAVVPMIGQSATVARGWQTPLGLVFIDGGHSFRAACRDYRLWVPHLVPEGFLVIHDVFFDPAEGGQAPVTLVRRALAGGAFAWVGQVHTLCVLRRRDQASLDICAVSE